MADTPQTMLGVLDRMRARMIDADHRRAHEENDSRDALARVRERTSRRRASDLSPEDTEWRFDREEDGHERDES